MNKLTETLRRRPGRASALLLGVMLLVGAVTLAPWRGRAEDRPRREGPGLAQQWEDVLLLDAVRYLKLTPAQVQRILPLARLAEERLRKLALEEARTTASLDRTAKKHRELLIQGKNISLQEQADALFLEKTMRAKRTQAGKELTDFIAPKLSKILTREQILWAFILANGDTPQKQPRRPALLDPQSGFVAPPELMEEVRIALIRRALYARHPRALVDAQLSLPQIRAMSIDISTGDHLQVLKLAPSAQPGWSIGQGSAQAEKVLQRFSAAARESAAKAQAELEERWGQLPVLLTSGATEDEIVAALRPLVRRMFLSPRLKPALDEWMQKGGGPVEDQAPGAAVTEEEVK